jgi:hypothetical protein
VRRTSEDERSESSGISTARSVATEERSERPADRREAGDCSNGVLASAASEGSIDERSESIGERSEP